MECLTKPSRCVGAGTPRAAATTTTSRRDRLVADGGRLELDSGGGGGRKNRSQPDASGPQGLEASRSHGWCGSASRSDRNRSQRPRCYPAARPGGRHPPGEWAGRAAALSAASCRSPPRYAGNEVGFPLVPRARLVSSWTWSPASTLECVHRPRGRGARIVEFDDEGSSRRHRPEEVPCKCSIPVRRPRRSQGHDRGVRPMCHCPRGARGSMFPRS